MLNYPTLLLCVKCQMKSPSVHIDKAHWQCILGRLSVFGAVLRKALGFILQRGYVCALRTRKSTAPESARVSSSHRSLKGQLTVC